jgi:soluble cytochrome b562
VLWAVPAFVALIFAAQHPLAAQEKDSAPSASRFRPVAPRIDLMEWHDKSFNAMRLAIAKKKPEAAEHAWLLAELANVNGRHSDKADYRKWASEVSNAAAEIAKSAKDKNFDRAKELAKKMSDTCTACHDQYQ